MNNTFVETRTPGGFIPSPPPMPETPGSRRETRSLPLLTAETGWAALKQSIVMLRITRSGRKKG